MKIRSVDVDAMARTVWGESRGEPFAGQVAVAHVILNRWRSPVTWWKRERGDGIPDDTIEAVTRDPWQFTCWKDQYPRIIRVDLETKAFRTAMRAAIEAIDVAPDPTKGSCHYYADHIKAPAWARGKKPVVVIGHHRFFDNVS